MGNKTTLIVAFSAILVLFFGMTLFDDAQAMKSKGNSLTEVSSKQVCGNFLCDEPLSIAEKIAIYLLTLAQQEETETEILQQAQATFANSRGIAHKGSGGISTVFPDVSKTPSPGGPVPIPYLNIGESKEVPKASKLAAKLINKYNLKEEKLSLYLQKPRIEGGTLLENDQLTSSGDNETKSNSEGEIQFEVNGNVTSGTPYVTSSADGSREQSELSTDGTIDLEFDEDN